VVMASHFGRCGDDGGDRVCSKSILQFYAAAASSTGIMHRVTTYLGGDLSEIPL
jgi:hypothetical protein